jgi:putative ABC transport system substrate-binding protein
LLAVAFSASPVNDEEEIEAVIIVAMAREYPYCSFTAHSAGLISHAVDNADPFRRAATSIDRILKGAEPRALPIQQRTKFGLALNLKTAKALGITFASMLLATGDGAIV